MFATVEMTARAKSAQMVSRMRSLRGYSVFDRSEATEPTRYSPKQGGGSQRDGETSDFRQNGRETFRNYCSFEGAITECRSKRCRRGNIWRTMFTAETPGCFKCSLATFSGSQHYCAKSSAGECI